MKVKYKGSYYSDITFDKEKEYEVMSIEEKWFRIMTELDEDYLFPPEAFEITDLSGYDELKIRDDNMEWKKIKTDDRFAV